MSHQFVLDVRKELEGEGKVPQKKTVRQKAVEALADPENEGKSNRQIAREIGVDEKTIRSAEFVNDGQNSQVGLAPLRDMFGNELLGEVAIDFENISPQIKNHLKALGAIQRSVNELYDDEEPATRFLIHSQFKTAVRDLKALLGMLIPHCLCPSCGGDGCEGCRGCGWLPEHVYSTAVPHEQRW